MSTPMQVDRDWFQAKIRAADKTQRALANHLDIDPAAVSLILNGRRNVSASEAAKISAFIEQPLGEVFRRLGMPEPQRGSVGDVPIVGVVNGEGSVVEGRALGSHVPPPDCQAGTVAVQARTAMTPLAIWDGWLFFHRPGGPISDAIGKLSVVKIKDGPTVLRWVQRGYRPGTFSLHSASGDAAEDVRVESAAPVLWIAIP